MSTISLPLYGRKGSIRATAIIDAEEQAVTENRWFLHSKGYAVRNLPGHRREFLHRQILGVSGHVHVDHISGDKLDNRKANLRIADNQQNHRNLRRRKTWGTSRFKGVY